MAKAKQKFSKRGLNFMLRDRSIQVLCSVFVLPAFFAMGQTSSPLIASSVLPPMGVASSETIQVNVINNASTPTAPDAAAPSCSGTIAFYSATGSIIGTPTSFTIGNEQIFSASLPYSATGATGARTVVRAIITLAATAWAGLVPPPACALGSSMETYDTLTGVTHAFATGTAPPLTAVVIGAPKGQVYDAITNK
jgi:hypothetical protein